MSQTTPRYLTIRQTAATGLLTEHRLRIMVAEGECPGFYAGNRFLVNTDALIEKLNSESCRNENACVVKSVRAQEVQQHGKNSD